MPYSQSERYAYALNKIQEEIKSGRRNKMSDFTARERKLVKRLINLGRIETVPGNFHEEMRLV